MYDYQYIFTDCGGCKYEESNDITVHCGICNHCKRTFHTEFERDIHEDLYEKKEDS